MIIMNIAEWIANIFILGIAGLVWVAVIFGSMLVISVIIKTVKEFKNDWFYRQINRKRGWVFNNVFTTALRFGFVKYFFSNNKIGDYNGISTT